MAIKLVQFEDKENIDTNPDLPRINKVTDDDVNELKDVSNANANNAGDLANLNTSNKNSLVEAINELSYNMITNGNPVKTGIKIDGKEEYVVFINVGNLPNNSSKRIDFDTSETTITRQISGYRKDSSGQYTNIPDNSNSGIIRFYINSEGLFIFTNYNASSWTGYIQIYFTYNS